MAKPSTAHTVAPRLALSQKVEFFRSACAMCLRGGSMRQSVGEGGGRRAKSQKEERGGSTEHDGALQHSILQEGVAKGQDKELCAHSGGSFL